jgi:succinoglycan biosynthesis protein ExoO
MVDNGDEDRMIDGDVTDRGAERMPEVSVIVANYNAAPFIEACLRSILDGTLADLEVILVDDVSSDDGLAVARRVAAGDARVRVVEMATNGGPAAARNSALELARGRFVAIVDSDDLLHPDRLARLVAAADEAGADMVADDLLVFDDGSAAAPRRFLKPADRAAPFRLDLDEYLRRSVLYGPEPAPGFLKPMIRRSSLVAANIRYDETLRIAEDDDLVARLLLAGLDYRIVPMPWYFYRKHGRSISHRLTLAAVEAMHAADIRLTAAVTATHPDLASRMTTRRRALERVIAFERLIASLKARRPGQAAMLLAHNPAVVPMLRMPLTGFLRKLRGNHALIPIAPDEQFAQLRHATDRG